MTNSKSLGGAADPTLLAAALRLRGLADAWKDCRSSETWDRSDRCFAQAENLADECLKVVADIAAMGRLASLPAVGPLLAELAADPKPGPAERLRLWKRLADLMADPGPAERQWDRYLAERDAGTVVIGWEHYHAPRWACMTRRYAAACLTLAEAATGEPAGPAVAAGRKRTRKAGTAESKKRRAALLNAIANHGRALTRPTIRGLAQQTGIAESTIRGALRCDTELKTRFEMLVEPSGGEGLNRGRAKRHQYDDRRDTAR